MRHNMVYIIMFSLNHCSRDNYNNDELVTGSALEALNTAVKLHLPAIAAMLRVVCVLPITSNEAERSFSRLKLVKTAIRSTMTNKR